MYCSRPLAGYVIRPTGVGDGEGDSLTLMNKTMLSPPSADRPTHSHVPNLSLSVSAFFLCRAIHKGNIYIQISRDLCRDGGVSSVHWTVYLHCTSFMCFLLSCNILPVPVQLFRLHHYSFPSCSFLPMSLIFSHAQ